MPLTQNTTGRIQFGRKAFAKKTFVNLTGFVLPLAVGLVTIPFIIRGFGVDRFGLLTLAWAIIGYFSLFDMGIGRAVTQLVAERLGHVPDTDVSKLVWTGLLIMAVFATLGTVVTASLASWLISSILKVGPALKVEGTQAFIVLSLAIPAVVLSSGFNGFLAALQRFDLINAIRIPLGMMVFIVPLIVLTFSTSLSVICTGLLIVRFSFLILYMSLCFRAFPPLRTCIGIDRSVIRNLLNFGGWMTVSNLVGPLMVYVDRFVIGAVLSISAVTYYVTPYEMVTRLWAIPAAIVAVLFPTFAAANRDDTDQAKVLYSMGGRFIVIVLAPIVLIMVVFASEGLYVWLDAEFSQKSTVVLQCLAIGVFINSFAQVPFALIQGIGRADITAKLHLLEMPVYLFLLFWMLSNYGITGVAVAWLFRIVLDAFLLTLMTHRLAKHITSANRQIFPLLAVTLIVFAIGMVIEHPVGKIYYATASILVLFGIIYRFFVTPDEKTEIRKSMWRIFSFKKI